MPQIKRQHSQQATRQRTIRVEPVPDAEKWAMLRDWAESHAKYYTGRSAEKKLSHGLRTQFEAKAEAYSLVFRRIVEIEEEVAV